MNISRRKKEKKNKACSQKYQRPVWPEAFCNFHPCYCLNSTSVRFPALLFTSAPSSRRGFSNPLDHLLPSVHPEAPRVRLAPKQPSASCGKALSEPALFLSDAAWWSVQAWLWLRPTGFTSAFTAYQSTNLFLLLLLTFRAIVLCLVSV